MELNHILAIFATHPNIVSARLLGRMGLCLKGAGDSSVLQYSCKMMPSFAIPPKFDSRGHAIPNSYAHSFAIFCWYTGSGSPSENDDLIRDVNRSTASCAQLRSHYGSY